MDTFAPHQPHRIQSRAVRPRLSRRTLDVPVIQGATIALPAGLLLWVMLIWAATRFF